MIISHILTIFAIWVKAGKTTRRNEIIDIIIGRRTRVRPTHNSYVAMAYDETSKRFISTRDTDSIHTEIKINRDGSQHIFSSNGSWLCSMDGELTKCEKPTLFDIEATTLGFRISHSDKCLTMGRVYRFEGCSKLNRDQEFVLELNKKLICGDMFIYDVGEEVVDLTKKVDIKAADEKKLKETMDRMKTAGPETKRAIKKLWSRRKYKWPSWGLC